MNREKMKANLGIMDDDLFDTFEKEVIATERLNTMTAKEKEAYYAGLIDDLKAEDERRAIIEAGRGHQIQ